MKSKGFTLIELLLVAVLISVLLYLSLPRFKRAYENLQLQNFSREIYFLALNLQAKAISERKVYCLTIDSARNEFSTSFRVRGVLKPAGDESHNRYPIPAGITLSVEPQDTNEIYFYPDANIDPVKLVFKDERLGREVSLIINADAADIQIQ